MLTTSSRKATLFFFMALMLVIVGLFFKMIAPYLLTLLMGVILAVLLAPIHRRLIRRRVSPPLAAGLVSLGLLLLVLVPLTIFGIAAARQAIAIVDALSQRSLNSYQWMLDWIFDFEPMKLLIGSPEDIKIQLATLAKNVVGALSNAALTLAGSVPDFMLQLILALFASYFFLLDGQTLMRWTSSRLPIEPNVRRVLYHSFQESAVSVFLASIAAAATQAVLMLLSFSVLQVPGALLAAGTTFIFAWVPILGSMPVWGVGAVYLYLQGSILKAILMVVAGLITSVSDNIVRPLVLAGASDSMHPLLSLVAIFGGLAMFGITGVFIGPIVASMVIAVLNAWPEVARQSNIMLEATASPLPPHDPVGPA